MRYWFKYNVIWTGSSGELPNVALAEVHQYYTDYGTGHFVKGSDNIYLGYIDCDSEANRDIVINNLSRFSPVLMTDDDVCVHVEGLIPIGTIVQSKNAIDLVAIDEEVVSITMVDGFPKTNTVSKSV